MEVRKASDEVAAATGWRRAAAEGFASAGGAVRTALGEDACAEGGAADLAAARAASSSS